MRMNTKFERKAQEYQLENWNIKVGGLGHPDFLITAWILTSNLDKKCFRTCFELKFDRFGLKFRFCVKKFQESKKWVRLRAERMIWPQRAETPREGESIIIILNFYLMETTIWFLLCHFGHDCDVSTEILAQIECSKDGKAANSMKKKSLQLSMT